jgi:uncharacterized repeat protein (TIGR01451 family)
VRVDAGEEVSPALTSEFSGMVTVASAGADVARTKSGPTSAAGTSNVTYTITVTNLGPSTASNVVVLDTLPAGATFVGASGGGNHSGGVITWPTLTHFANAAATNFMVTVTAPDNGTLTNVVSRTSDSSNPVASNHDGSSASGQVVTLILGVNVPGYAYLDANKNGFKDGAEAGHGSWPLRQNLRDPIRLRPGASLN